VTALAKAFARVANPAIAYVYLNAYWIATAHAMEFARTATLVTASAIARHRMYANANVTLNAPTVFVKEIPTVHFARMMKMPTASASAIARHRMFANANVTLNARTVYVKRIPTVRSVRMMKMQIAYVNANAKNPAPAMIPDPAPAMIPDPVQVMAPDPAQAMAPALVMAPALAMAPDLDPVPDP
jgi:hypothetical protein